jgi:hypothetical protein
MASLGLDPRAWQACTGISKDKKKTACFHNLMTRESFYALPPDECHKTHSDEELKCSVPPDNVNGLNAHFSKVIDRTRLEVGSSCFSGSCPAFFCGCGTSFFVVEKLLERPTDSFSF